MRKWMVRCLAVFSVTALLCGSAFAVAPGFYIGMEAGPGYNTGEGTNVRGTGAPLMGYPRKTMFTVGGYMGYLFNTYLGAEMGANYFNKVNYSTGTEVPLSSPSVAFGSVNILATGTFPMGNFKVLGKAGGAIIFQTISQTLIPQDSSKNRHAIKPMFSIGLGYDLTQSWVVDASWAQINSVYLLSNVNFAVLSFSYHFVDRYCGQFLCDE